MRFNSTMALILKLILISPLLSSLISWGLSAPQTFKSPRTQVKVITNIDSIDPTTKSFYIALHFKLSKHWHIYWKNSGDSGTPPSIEFDGSSAYLEFSPIHWPAPKRIAVAPLMSYGYENEVVLPVLVTLAENSVAPKNITLKANWLVCKVECIPETKTFDFKMPLSNESTISEESAIIQKFLSQKPENVSGLQSFLSKDKSHFKLNIKSSAADIFAETKNAYFYSEEGLRVKHAASQTFASISPSEIKLSIERDENDDDSKTSLQGILELEKADGSLQFIELNTAPTGNVPFDASTLLLSIGFAFIGGLLLNLMPCVFPVLFLKLYALTKNHSLTAKQRKVEAWSYGAGVVSSFIALAVILLILKSVGLAVGWGFQLQSPLFVAAAFLLFVSMGLSLMGVYEFSGSFVGAGQSLTQKSGARGSFFTGVLATLVATPCSAPFMGSAVGYALTRSSWEALIVFLVLGAGLAFPYVLLSYFPSLLKWIPKPGIWMERLKEFFGFALFGTALWLLWIFSTQQNSEAMISLLISALFLALGLWALRIQKKKIKNTLLVLCTFSAAYFFKNSTAPISHNSSTNSLKGKWEDFSPEKLKVHLDQNKAVFIDFTASWCLTCQVNKKLVLNTEDANAIFDSNEVVRMRADWTNYDPVITQTLAKLGRQSVPVYVYYAKGKKDPVLLPELLSKEILEQAIITNKEDR